MRKILIAGIALSLSLAIAAPAFAKVTARATSTQEVHITKGVRDDHAKKAIQGTVKEISANSLVLTVHNADYTVTTTTSTRLVNRVWHKITLADIKGGDKIRVSGTITGTSITAEIVRDISIPTPSSIRAHATTTPTR